MEHYQKYYKVKKYSLTKKESLRRQFSLPVGKIITCSECNSKFAKINTT